MIPARSESGRPGHGEETFRRLFRERGLAPETVSSFRKIIRAYYRGHGRELPWRETEDPYRILVSEIMLQQTQVERVIPKYREFLTAFPDFRSLADSPLERVLSVWQGLGYNRRAIALRRTALIVADAHDGSLPPCAEALASFPGIGAYTASALCAFAFRMPTVFIETNIRRVFLHFFFFDCERVRDSSIRPLVGTTMDRRDPRQWYYALMDYGAMLRERETNPNRRSAHYARQPSFEGSRRQLRGRILKTIIGSGSMTERDIMGRLPEWRKRQVRDILHQLAEEGFLQREHGCFRIASS